MNYALERNGHPPEVSESEAEDVRTLDFERLTIRYDDRVLSPRTWTATQARWAARLAEHGPPGPLLELCCGAGHIGLLAVSLHPRPLVAVDSDPVACAYARRNAAAAGLGELVEVRRAALEHACPPEERYAVVIADPPWVPRESVDDFPEDPPAAIDGGPDGLDVARTCVAVAARHLEPGGSLVLQLGNLDQVDRLSAELPSLGGLVRREVRRFPRGTLLRLDHPHG